MNENLIFKKTSPWQREVENLSVSKIQVIVADKMKLFLLPSNLESPESRRLTLLSSDKYEKLSSI